MAVAFLPLAAGGSANLLNKSARCAIGKAHRADSQNRGNTARGLELEDPDGSENKYNQPKEQQAADCVPHGIRIVFD